jgi:site-specific DNA-methyltransferase (adenine-specific)
VGNQTVIAGDCLVALNTIASASVDVVVTSPPYNIGVRYRTYDDHKPRAAYVAWLAEIGRQLLRVLRPAGCFFLDVGSTSADP